MPLCRLKAEQKHSYRDPNAKSPTKGMRQLEPGSEVELTDSQYKAWSDKFDLIGPTEVEKAAAKATKKDAEDAALEITPDGKGKFNVVNKTTGEPVNDEPLPRSKAEELAAV